MSATPFRQWSTGVSSWPRSWMPADFAAAQAAGIRTDHQQSPGRRGDGPADRRRGQTARGSERTRLRVRARGVGPDGAGRVDGIQGCDHRQPRAPSRLLPLWHALLPHVGVRHAAAAARRDDDGGRCRRRLRPDTDPTDPGTPLRRLNSARHLRHDRPQKDSASGGPNGTAVSAREWLRAGQGHRQPQQRCEQEQPGQAFDAEPGACRRQELGVTETPARRDRAAADRPSRCRPAPGSRLRRRRARRAA